MKQKTDNLRSELSQFHWKKIIDQNRKIETLKAKIATEKLKNYLESLYSGKLKNKIKGQKKKYEKGMLANKIQSDLLENPYNLLVILIDFNYSLDIYTGTSDKRFKIFKFRSDLLTTELAFIEDISDPLLLISKTSYLAASIILEFISIAFKKIEPFRSQKVMILELVVSALDILSDYSNSSNFYFLYASSKFLKVIINYATDESSNGFINQDINIKSKILEFIKNRNMNIFDKFGDNITKDSIFYQSLRKEKAKLLEIIYKNILSLELFTTEKEDFYFPLILKNYSIEIPMKNRLIEFWNQNFERLNTKEKKMFFGIWIIAEKNNRDKTKFLSSLNKAALNCFLNSKVDNSKTVRHVLYFEKIKGQKLLELVYMDDIWFNDSKISQKLISKFISTYRSVFGKRENSLSEPYQNILNLLYNKFSEKKNAPEKLKIENPLVLDKFSRRTRYLSIKPNFCRKSVRKFEFPFFGIKSFDLFCEYLINTNISILNTKSQGYRSHSYSMFFKNKADNSNRLLDSTKDRLNETIIDVLNEKRILKISCNKSDDPLESSQILLKSRTYFLGLNYLVKIYYKTYSNNITSFEVYDIVKRKIVAEYNFQDLGVPDFEEALILEFKEQSCKILTVNKLQIKVFTFKRKNVLEKFLKKEKKIKKLDLYGKNIIKHVEILRLKNKNTGETKKGLVVAHKDSHTLELLNFDLEWVLDLEIILNEQKRVKFFNENTELFIPGYNSVGIRSKNSKGCVLVVNIRNISLDNF